MRTFRNVATILTAAAACATTTLADTASRYIQDGLLACWDGYENAGAGLHNASATVWKDLVGGYEFTLTGVTVERDRMVFAGTQQSYGTMGATGTAATFEKAKNGTMEIVYASDTGLNSQIMLQSSSTSGIMMSIWEETKLIASTASAPTFTYTSGTATNSVSVLYSAAKPTTAYAGGVRLNSPKNTNWNSETGKTTIGTRNSRANNPFGGAIYCIRVYSRQLTEAEIHANYAVDVRRFIECITDDGDCLEISAKPDELGAPTPDYGLLERLAPGASQSVSCPPVWTNAAGTTAATCTGWKLYDESGNVMSNGSETAFTYIHPSPAAFRRLEWQWGIEYKVAASAGAGGLVSVARQWFAEGATCAITATPDTGNTFVKWTGDLPEDVDAFDPSPSFKVNGPCDMHAEFGAAPDSFVEYVESTNTSTYIDTGLIPSASSTRLVATLAPMVVNNTEAALFGVRSSTTAYGSDAAYALLISSNFRLDWIRNSNQLFKPTVGRAYTFDLVNNYGFINNSFYISKESKSATAITHSFYFFAMNNNGALKAGMKQRLYGARLYTNSTVLAANYVPCIRGGVAGLYDTVSGRTLLPQNFPLVASDTPHPSLKIEGGILKAKLSVTCGEGGTISQTGDSWVPVGSQVTISATPGAGLQAEWTTDAAGNHFADTTAGAALSLVMPPYATSVSAAFRDDAHVPFVTDLNPIIAATPAGGTISLAEGKYSLNIRALLNKAITITGAGIDRTIVTSPKGTRQRAFSLTDAGAILRDLTVSGCSNNVPGSGIYMSAGTVTGVKVTANDSGLGLYVNCQIGGGIYMDGGGTVTNCVIHANTHSTTYGYSYGSGVGMTGGTLVDSVVSGCYRNRNQTRGAGLYIKGPAHVLRCRIVGNGSNKQGLSTTDTRGMGIWMVDNADAVVEQCEIVSNQHHAVYMNKGTLRNCLIWGHNGTSSSASLPAGVEMAGGNLYNNTISANYSPANNPGLYMTSGTAVNNIIYGNTGGAYGASVSGGTFNTNIVSDTTYVTTANATGNTTGDPLMAAPANGDFTIGFSSPAVDAGAALASVAVDFAGTERPQDGNGDGTAAPDIGAYEYMPGESEAMDAAIVMTDTDFRYDGTVTASARVAGGSGEYTYEWYLDGALVPDQTTGEFSATGLSTGNHTLRLVVSDGETTVTDDYAGTIVFHPVEVYVSSTGSATFPYDTPETATDAPSDAFAALWLASDTTCTVHVAEGTYYLSSQLAISKPCRILGAGRDATVLSGARLPFAYRAITMTDANSIVRDLTVRDCRNNLTGCAIYMSAGLLENVRATANEAGLGSGSTPASGVGLYMEGGTATNCLFDCNSQNTSYGDGKGVGVYITSGLLVDCVITNNWRDRNQIYGVGVYATGGTVRRCDIRGNSNKNNPSYSEAAGMGVCLNGSGALVENCVIQDNGRQGVYLQSGTLRNCLVTGHGTASSNFAGGVYMTGGKLYNCTVADNVCSTAAYNDLRMTSGTAANTIAIVATVAGGTTNGCLLNADALFKGASTGNYHLTMRSPAINIGDNSIWSGVADAVDLDGNPRIVPKRNGVVDAGCYEAQPLPATVLFLQ